MWSPDQITIEIEDAEQNTAMVRINTPAGCIDVIAEVSIGEGRLTLEGAHVQGLEPGKLGRSGLNAIGSKLMAEADVREIVVHGGTRTTGRKKGTKPRPIRFPRSGSPHT